MGTPPVSESRELGLDVQGRIEIVEGAISTFEALGYRGTTRDDIAQHVGISVDDILSQFPSWHGLILAVIDRWNARRLTAVQAAAGAAGTLELMRHLVVWNVENPALMRMLTGLSAEAIDPAHPAAAYFRERYRLFHEVVEASIRQDVARGIAPASMDPAPIADQLIALYEGLQLQAMLRPDMDLEASFNRAVRYLTQGW